jgi:hypothetical protein
MTICYKFMLDLPALPEPLVMRALKFSRDNNKVQSHSGIANDTIGGNPYAYRREVLRNLVSTVSRSHVRFAVDEKIEKWVHNNISQQASSVGLSTSVGDQSHFNSAHTDVLRSFVLIYLLDVSNTDQDTVFWREPEQSLHRDRAVTPYDLDRLIRVDSVRIPLKTWCYLDSRILHSVENIQHSRVALQVSFDQDSFKIFDPVPENYQVLPS